MKLLTDSAMMGYRNYTKRTIHHAKYKIDSTWYETDIDSVDITPAGVVEITFMINGNGGGTVKEIQLFDNENVLWLRKSESLKLNSIAEGFLYTCQVEIKEKED